MFQKTIEEESARQNYSPENWKKLMFNRYW
jgi:hypothetical protein